MMTTKDVSSALRKVKMPPDVLTIGSGDPDELTEFISQLSYLAATCATTDRRSARQSWRSSRTSTAGTREQKRMAAKALKMNDVWRE